MASSRPDRAPSAMNAKLEALRQEVRKLERAMVGEAREKETADCYQVHAKAVEFTAAAKVRHRRLRLGIPS